MLTHHLLLAAHNAVALCMLTALKHICTGTDTPVRLHVAVMDEDTISGDDLICETDITVTSTSLQQRSSSVLWHTLVYKSLHSGHVRLGTVWVPAISEPIAISSIRPEEYVSSGSLYIWIVDAHNLRDVTVLGMRPTSPPEIEIEVRPYAKKGKKRAKVSATV
jgi:hypothetical protein